MLSDRYNSVAISTSEIITLYRKAAFVVVAVRIEKPRFYYSEVYRCNSH